MSSNLFFSKINSGIRPTSEHWAPCKPLLQALGGLRYYLGVATYVFLDGRQVIAYTDEAATEGEALQKTFDACRELPAPSIEGFLSR